MKTIRIEMADDWYHVTAHAKAPQLAERAESLKRDLQSALAGN